VAHHGLGGNSLEGCGNGASMAKVDGFLSYGGSTMWGAHLGGFHSMLWHAHVVHNDGTKAHPSVVPRARSSGQTESGPAQTNVLTTSLHWLGIIGARRAL
jgi:hypothetical protein